VDCFYINLDSATERRAAIEANFLQHKTGDWTLSRFAAVDTNYVRANNIPGTLTPSEKACFLSHKFLIKAQRNNETPVLLMEDDSIFGKSTCSLIDDHLLNKSDSDWDILFTDIAVTSLQQMVELTQLRPKFHFGVLNLASIWFAGASSYIVNPKSINKIIDLMDRETSLDIPYDLYLRELIRKNEIRAYTFFPFATSLSELASQSQIEHNDGSALALIWDTFRKLTWFDRDIEMQKSNLGKVDRTISDDECKMFGTLFAAMMFESKKDK
jgi:GR25 family glycosyltransferase involved in LPS biosynthesis